uniref:BPTI/Kunitz inhibitor domain-containing protein n=1 Tax=Apteryx owenii TaxID=8824 RepID=A0A8B9P2I1_APTOW
LPFTIRVDTGSSPVPTGSAPRAGLAPQPCTSLSLAQGLTPLVSWLKSPVAVGPDFCYLPSVCGNCKALFVRFFYNVSSQQCEEFIYGGCGGNRNNFETKGECFQACSHVGN